MMTARIESPSARAHEYMNSIKGNSCVWKTRLEKNQATTLARLVKEAKILSTEEIVEAMEIAESLKQSVDQVLFNSGFLHGEVAKLCTRAMQFIEEGLCAEYLVALGLGMAAHKRLSFEDGLRYYGWGW
ncbi:MAG: hypothetical protein K2X77_09900 [Candidatus Obscuribacterales bacterium]|jgi:hypothetical protein|nr:hypothetical protein [Candidatus Obscuribacterales bacterium]